MTWRVRLAPPIVAAILLVAAELGVDPAAIVARPHGSDAVVLARQMAAYLCAVSLEIASATKLAPAFSRHRSTIDRARQLIEDRRDDPVFDERLSRMEMRLQALTYKSTRRLVQIAAPSTMSVTARSAGAV